MTENCEKCGGKGYIPCKHCAGTGADAKEISGTCMDCGGPGRFPCWDCDQTGKVKKAGK